MKKPEHVAIIMDGNGRWARSRNRPRSFGHQQGVKALERITRAGQDLGIDYLTVFAFSTENWQRPRKEVNFLFDLLKQTINDELDKLQSENDIKIKIMGRREELSQGVKDDIAKIEKISADNRGLNLNIALNYGGRAEIVDAVNKIIESDLEKITEESFADFLYMPELPQVDLLIRTGGEQRISNFLLWQLSYAELYFTSCLWPDFSREDFIKALNEFENRARKFGRVPSAEEKGE